MNIKTLWSGVGRGWRRLTAACPTSALLLGAGTLMVAGAVVRLVSGSPFSRGVMAEYGERIPPVFLMGLLWMLWYGVLGATLSGVLCGRQRDVCSQIARYRGGMLFLGMIFLGFLWYPLFFIAGQTVLALLVHLAVLVLCVLTALCYMRYFRTAAVVLFCHAAYLLWLAVVSVAVLVG